MSESAGTPAPPVADRPAPAGDHRTVLHSVHGLVTIALEDAPPHAIEQVRRMFGPSDGAVADEADLRVRFVERLTPVSPLRYIGLNDAAFDSDFFYLLDEVGNRIRVDLALAGDAIELWCESGVRHIPLLVPLVGLRLLRNGHVLVHASAFAHRDRGIVVMGWRKGGKTELVLAFAANGAEFLSDEWTIVSGDGTVRGLPSIAGLWGWHFRYRPEYRHAISRMQRARLRAMDAYRRVYGFVPTRARGSGRIARLLYRLSLDGTFSPLSMATPSPEQLFGDAIRHDAVPLHRVLFGTVGDDSTTTAAPISAAEVAARMAASLQFERRPLLEAYDRFRFAFPDRRNELLENAAEHEQRRLESALAGVTAYEVRHPYPVPLDELYRVAAPLCA